ncbi:MAG: protocatechuate 3,4-dioxygenase subunit alpha [Pseudomonadota bacterium]
MADMMGFGDMDLGDRGGEHRYKYKDAVGQPSSVGPTPSQTVGPFFAYGLTPGPYGYAHKEIHATSLLPSESDETQILIEGQVFDGAGVPVHDAIVEIVQADSAGNYASAPRNDGFTGFGRCGTGAGGLAAKGGDTHFRFHTVKPGATGDGQAPFVTVIVTMRGLLNHCITRLYFPGDQHDDDLVMRQVPQERRTTLVAEETGPNRYRFDVHMQGERETVFFDL